MGATRKKIAEFLGNSERTVENWEKEERYILSFIRRYLNDDNIIDEFIKTKKISKFEDIKISPEKNDLNEHIIFHAIRKIKQIPNLFLVGKKEFWLKGFLKVVENSEKYTKEDFIQSILSLKQNLLEAENWKGLTAAWIEENLSEYEIKLIMLNKDRVIRELSV